MFARVAMAYVRWQVDEQYTTMLALRRIFAVISRQLPTLQIRPPTCTLYISQKMERHEGKRENDLTEERMSFVSCKSKYVVK